MTRPLAILLLMAWLGACAKPAEPETRCFTSPYLYCSQLSDGDGE